MSSYRKNGYKKTTRKHSLKVFFMARHEVKEKSRTGKSYAAIAAEIEKETGETICDTTIGQWNKDYNWDGLNRNYFLRNQEGITKQEKEMLTAMLTHNFEVKK